MVAMASAGKNCPFRLRSVAQVRWGVLRKITAQPSELGPKQEKWMNFVNGLSSQTISALIKWSLENASPDRGAHITRFKMYRELQDAFRQVDGPEKRILAISSSAGFGHDILGLKAAAYTEAHYPSANMLDLKFETGTFDFCVSDQVLEHVEGDPFKAFSESVRVLKKGGFVCHTTCFLNEIHGSPKDFWRFTPDALSLMARSAGCEIVASEGWGNRDAWAIINAGFRFHPIPNDPRHPLHEIAVKNEKEWPIHVWIIARKLA